MMRRTILTGAKFTTAAAGLVLAANLGVAERRYSAEYLRRLAFWGRRESMDDPQRFPERRIAASSSPFRFDTHDDGSKVLHTAFAAIASRRGAAGESFESFLARTQSTSLLLLRDDRLSYEGYFNGAERGTLLTSMSMSKSVLALLVGAAIADGLLPSTDVFIEQLLPDLVGLHASNVTLRQLMQMSSGLQFEDEWPLSRLTLHGLFSGSRVAYFTPDIRAYIATARLGHAPGTIFAYDDRAAQLVGLILERVTGGRVSDYLAQKLWQPLGMEYPAAWNLDRPDGFEKMESGLNATAVDWLKLGRLLLKGGTWEEVGAVLPTAWLREAMTAPWPTALPGFIDTDSSFAGNPGLYYALLWWGFAHGSDSQPDSFAHGLYGQVLYVSRRKNLALLRTGWSDGGVPYWPGLMHDLAQAMPDTGNPTPS